MSSRIYTYNRGYGLHDSRTIRLNFVMLFFLLCVPDEVLARDHR